MLQMVKSASLAQNMNIVHVKTRNNCSTKCPLCVHRVVQKFADRPG